MVPMLAASWPSAAQICRVNAATEVLPLVPVTAAIVSGLARIEARRRERERAPHVVGAHERDVVGKLLRRAAAMTAAAPAASACGTKDRPSALVPGTATNRWPGFTLRLSDAMPLEIERREARVELAVRSDEVCELHVKAPGD